MSRRSLVIFYILFLLCVMVCGPYLLAIAIGAMFAYLSENPFSRLCRKLKIKKQHTKWIAASVLVGIVLILFLVPLIYGIISGVLQISELIVQNKEFIAKQIPDIKADEVNLWLERVHFPMRFAEIAGRLNQMLASAAQAVAGGIGAAIQGTPQAILQLMLALFGWVVFLMEGKQYRESILPLIIPWQPERDIICTTTADVLRGVVVASAMVSLVQSTVVTVFLLISGTTNPFLLGVLSFFASFIPIVGTMPILLGAAAYCYFNGSVGWAIFLVLSIVIVGSIDNLLRPYFFKGSVDLSFFWITTAFLGGLATAGIAGAVLGPLLFSLFSVFYKRTLQNRA